MCRSIRISIFCSIPITRRWARGILAPAAACSPRPGLDQVMAYRRHVDAAMESFLLRLDG